MYFKNAQHLYRNLMKIVSKCITSMVEKRLQNKGNVWNSTLHSKSLVYNIYANVPATSDRKK